MRFAHWRGTPRRHGRAPTTDSVRPDTRASPAPVRDVPVRDSRETDDVHSQLLIHRRDTSPVSKTHSDLAHAVGARCRLTGNFQLRSGRTANTYFDKYLFESDPVLLAQIAELMVPMIPERTEVLAGLELGGVPVVTALSLASGLPAAFVRKQAKPYGTAQLAEGADIIGRRALVVEDVITTGGQVVASTNDLRERGAHVEAVLFVIDRSDGHHAQLEAADIEVTALFTAADLSGAG